MSEVKYFVIGFNKCATSTFHEFFLQNKLTSQHTTKWETDNFDCFSDNGNLNNFELLDQKYPQAVFILNTRPLNKWLISRFEHGARYKRNWAYPFTENLAHEWINDRNDYYSRLLAHFQDRPHKLIIVDVSLPNWINYVAKVLDLKVSDVKSKNVCQKSADYPLILQCVNEVFKTLDYDVKKQEEILLHDPNLKEKYLNLYRTNASGLERNDEREKHIRSDCCGLNEACLSYDGVSKRTNILHIAREKTNAAEIVVSAPKTSVQNVPVPVRDSETRIATKLVQNKRCIGRLSRVQYLCILQRKKTKITQWSKLSEP